MMESTFDGNTSIEDLYGDLDGGSNMSDTLHQPWSQDEKTDQDDSDLDLYDDLTPTDQSTTLIASKDDSLFSDVSRDNPPDGPSSDCYRDNPPDVSGDNPPDLSLYDDLLVEEERQQQHSFKELHEKFEAAMKTLGKLEKENRHLQANVHEQSTARETMEKNMASLLLTARGEITRKEREISDLRNRLRKPQRRMNWSSDSVDSNFEPMMMSSPAPNRDPSSRHRSRQELSHRHTSKSSRTDTSSRRSDVSSSNESSRRMKESTLSTVEETSEDSSYDRSCRGNRIETNQSSKSNRSGRRHEEDERRTHSSKEIRSHDSKLCKDRSDEKRLSTHDKGTERRTHAERDEKSGYKKKTEKEIDKKTAGKDIDNTCRDKDNEKRYERKITIESGHKVNEDRNNKVLHEKELLRRNNVDAECQNDSHMPSKSIEISRTTSEINDHQKVVREVVKNSSSTDKMKEKERQVKDESRSERVENKEVRNTKHSSGFIDLREKLRLKKIEKESKANYSRVQSVRNTLVEVEDDIDRKTTDEYNDTNKMDVSISEMTSVAKGIVSNNEVNRRVSELVDEFKNKSMDKSIFGGTKDRQDVRLRQGTHRNDIYDPENLSNNRNATCMEVSSNKVSPSGKSKFSRTINSSGYNDSTIKFEKAGIQSDNVKGKEADVALNSSTSAGSVEVENENNAGAKLKEISSGRNAFGDEIISIPTTECIDIGEVQMSPAHNHIEKRKDNGKQDEPVMKHDIKKVSKSNRGNISISNGKDTALENQSDSKNCPQIPVRWQEVNVQDVEMDEERLKESQRTDASLHASAVEEKAIKERSRLIGLEQQSEANPPRVKHTLLNTEVNGLETELVKEILNKSKGKSTYCKTNLKQIATENVEVICDPKNFSSQRAIKVNSRKLSLSGKCVASESAVNFEEMDIDSDNVESKETAITLTSVDSVGAVEEEREMSTKQTLSYEEVKMTRSLADSRLNESSSSHKIVADEGNSGVTINFTELGEDRSSTVIRSPHKNLMGREDISKREETAVKLYESKKTCDYEIHSLNSDEHSNASLGSKHAKKREETNSRKEHSDISNDQASPFESSNRMSPHKPDSLDVPFHDSKEKICKASKCPDVGIHASGEEKKVARCDNIVKKLDNEVFKPRDENLIIQKSNKVCKVTGCSIKVSHLHPKAKVVQHDTEGTNRTDLTSISKDGVKVHAEQVDINIEHNEKNVWDPKHENDILENNSERSFGSNIFSEETGSVATSQISGSVLSNSEESDSSSSDTESSSSEVSVVSSQASRQSYATDSETDISENESLGESADSEREDIGRNAVASELSVKAKEGYNEKCLIDVVQKPIDEHKKVKNVTKSEQNAETRSPDVRNILSITREQGMHSQCEADQKKYEEFNATQKPDHELKNNTVKQNNFEAAQSFKTSEENMAPDSQSAKETDTHLVDPNSKQKQFSNCERATSPVLPTDAHNIFKSSPDKSFLLQSLLCGIETVMKSKNTENNVVIKNESEADCVQMKAKRFNSDEDVATSSCKNKSNLKSKENISEVKTMTNKAKTVKVNECGSEKYSSGVINTVETVGNEFSLSSDVDKIDVGDRKVKPCVVHPEKVKSGQNEEHQFSIVQVKTAEKKVKPGIIQTDKKDIDRKDVHSGLVLNKLDKTIEHEVHPGVVQACIEMNDEMEVAECDDVQHVSVKESDNVMNSALSQIKSDVVARKRIESPDNRYKDSTATSMRDTSEQIKKRISSSIEVDVFGSNLSLSSTSDSESSSDSGSSGSTSSSYTSSSDSESDDDSSSTEESTYSSEVEGHSGENREREQNQAHVMTAATAGNTGLVVPQSKNIKDAICDENIGKCILVKDRSTERPVADLSAVLKKESYSVQNGTIQTDKDSKMNTKDSQSATKTMAVGLIRNIGKCLVANDPSDKKPVAHFSVFANKESNPVQKELNTMDKDKPVLNSKDPCNNSNEKGKTLQVIPMKTPPCMAKFSKSASIMYNPFLIQDEELTFSFDNQHQAHASDTKRENVKSFKRQRTDKRPSGDAIDAKYTRHEEDIRKNSDVINVKSDKSNKKTKRISSNDSEACDGMKNDHFDETVEGDSNITLKSEKSKKKKSRPAGKFDTKVLDKVVCNIKTVNSSSKADVLQKEKAVIDRLTDNGKKLVEPSKEVLPLRRSPRKKVKESESKGQLTDSSVRCSPRLKKKEERLSFGEVLAMMDTAQSKEKAKKTVKNLVFNDKGKSNKKTQPSVEKAGKTADGKTVSTKQDSKAKNNSSSGTVRIPQDSVSKRSTDKADSCTSLATTEDTSDSANRHSRKKRGKSLTKNTSPVESGVKKKGRKDDTQEDNLGIALASDSQIRTSKSKPALSKSELKKKKSSSRSQKSSRKHSESHSRTSSSESENLGTRDELVKLIFGDCDPIDNTGVNDDAKKKFNDRSPEQQHFKSPKEQIDTKMKVVNMANKSIPNSDQNVFQDDDGIIPISGSRVSKPSPIKVTIKHHNNSYKVATKSRSKDSTTQPSTDCSKVSESKTDKKREPGEANMNQSVNIYEDLLLNSKTCGRKKKSPQADNKVKSTEKVRDKLESKPLFLLDEDTMDNIDYNDDLILEAGSNNTSLESSNSGKKQNKQLSKEAYSSEDGEVSDSDFEETIDTNELDTCISKKGSIESGRKSPLREERKTFKKIVWETNHVSDRATCPVEWDAQDLIAKEEFGFVTNNVPYLKRIPKISERLQSDLDEDSFVSPRRGKFGHKFLLESDYSSSDDTIYRLAKSPFDKHPHTRSKMMRKSDRYSPYRRSRSRSRDRRRKYSRRSRSPRERRRSRSSDRCRRKGRPDRSVENRRRNRGHSSSDKHGSSRERSSDRSRRFKHSTDVGRDAGHGLPKVQGMTPSTLHAKDSRSSSKKQEEHVDSENPTSRGRHSSDKENGNKKSMGSTSKAFADTRRKRRPESSDRSNRDVQDFQRETVLGSARRSKVKEKRNRSPDPKGSSPVSTTAAREKSANLSGGAEWKRKRHEVDSSDSDSSGYSVIEQFGIKRRKAGPSILT